MKYLKSKSLRRSIGGALFIAAILFTTMAKADIEWIGATDDYTNPADWSTAAVPGSTDNADNSNGTNDVIDIPAGSPAWTLFNLSAGEQPASGGAFEQDGSAVTVNGTLSLGEGSGSLGSYTLNAGALTSVTNTVQIGYGPGSTGVLTINSGGEANLGQVNLGQDPTATAVLNLNGGILETRQISSAANAAMSELNFNGGTLEATATNSDFVSGLAVAGIGPTGAVINCQNYTVTIPQSLSDNGGGSLTKLGTGTLILAGTNSYTGPTFVEAGTLIVSNLADGGLPSAIGASSADPTNLEIGDPYIYSGGSVYATFEYIGSTAVIDRGLVISNYATLDIESNLTFTGVAESVGSAQITKMGPATLTFAGLGTNTFSAGDSSCQFNQGTVVLDGSGGYQTNIESGQLWVGSTPNYPATLILTNTVLNTSDWFAVGRGNGTSNFASTASLYNSTLYVSTHPFSLSTSGISLGYHNGLTILSAPALNLYGNSLLVNQGGEFLIAESQNSTAMVNVTNSAAIISSGGVVVVGNAGAGTLNLNSTGVSSLATADQPGDMNLGVYIGGAPIPADETPTGVGAINQTSGTLICGTNNAYPFLTLGYSIYGFYNLSGGTLIGISLNGIDINNGGFEQSGGAFVCGGSVVLKNGVATFTGGSTLLWGPNDTVHDGIGSSLAAFNLGTEAGGTAIVTNLSSSNGVSFFVPALSSAAGRLNLNRGTLQLGGAIHNSAINGSSGVNLNGGTLQAGLNNISLMDTSLTNAYVFNGGLTVDTMTNAAAISANLLATTGNGIYPAGGTFVISTSGGLGYVGPPLVTVTGGSGAGAMAIATVANGIVTNVILTCPGQNYQAGDVLTFAFTGGGSSAATINFKAASSFVYRLQPGDITPNSGGGLTKIGTGTLSLTGNSTYTGPTLVNAGTLTGTGSIANGVTVAAGATLAAGSPSTTGTLTIGGALSFSPGSTSLMKLNKTAAANDLLAGMSQVTYGGTLVISNLAGTLTATDSFKLYNASSYNGAFSAMVPATPGPGLLWNTNQLDVNGTLLIANIVNTQATNIAFSVSGGSLNLSWPLDHLGWELEAQTDSLSSGLGTNWVIWAGSSNVVSESIPMNATNPPVFFRLVYP